MHIAALVIAASLLAFQCWLSFDPQLRRAWFFYPGVIGSSAMTSACWCVACAWLDDTEEIFMLSVVWEVVAVTVWYFLPIVLLYVDLSKEAILAVVLIAVGLLLLNVLHKPK